MIFVDPEKYGFNISDKNLYQKEKLKEIEVSKSINSLRDWAFEHDINYKQLKRYNPWLRTTKLSVRNGKTYFFEIPKYKEAPAIMSDTTLIMVEADTLDPDIREVPAELEGL